MSLLEELRKAGRWDSRGQFTLDRAKAREKMARFQLSDPRRYILELVEVAVLLGAEALDLETGRTLEIDFGGDALPAEGLQNLDDSLLANPDRPGEQALRALAMACAALDSLKATRLRVESPAGLWLERTREGEKSGPGSFRRHRILVEGISPGRSKVWPEEDLLAGEARYAPIPVRVRGHDLRREPELHGLGPIRAFPAQGAPRFLVVLARRGEASSLTLVSRGVVVGRRTPELAVPLHAIAWQDDLGRNASHSDVVEDHRLESLLEELSVCGARCAEGLAELLPTMGAGEEGEESRNLLVQLASAWKGSLPESFRGAPLLRDHLGFPLSLADLEAQLQILGQVPVCRESPPISDPGFRIARVDSAFELRLLESSFGQAVQDAGERVLQLLRRRSHLERWERNPRPNSLPPGEWLLRRRLEDPAGEVGLSPQDTDIGSLLHVLYRGRLLETRDLPTPLSYVAVLDFEELEIDEDWSRALDTDSFRQALARLDRHGEDLYEELARRGGPWSSAERSHLDLAFEMWGLRGRMPPEPLADLPWFEELRDGRVSLAALTRRKSVLLVGPRDPGFPRDLPEQVWPDAAFVPLDSLAARVLEGILPERLAPAAPELARLNELATRFGRRREPLLEDSPELLCRVEIRSGPVEGELGLLTEGERGTLELLREGVFLQTRTVAPSGPPFLAVIESPRLQPSEDWRAIQTDQAWAEVLSAVRQAEIQAGARLVGSWARGDLPLEARRVVQRVLRAWPDLVAEVVSVPLFLSAEGLVSIEELRQVVERGEELLLAGDSWLEPVLGRRVLPESECAGIRDLLPQARFTSARPWLEARQARDEFLLRPVQSARLSGRCLARRLLSPPREGEIALVEGGGGEVQVLLEGRWLQTVPGVLPAAARAVVQDPRLRSDLHHRQVLQDEAWQELLAGLAQELGILARELLERHPRAGSEEARVLLSLLAWPGLPRPLRPLLEEAPLLKALPDQVLGLAEVRRRMGRKHFLAVSPRDQGSPRDGRLVVLADSSLQLVLRAVLGRECRDDSRNLARDARYLAHLRKASSLPRKLSGCLLEVSVEGALLSGEMGFPDSPGAGGLVALREGQPLGRVEMPHHLSLAILEGDFNLDSGGNLLPLTREQRRELREHQIRLYGSLAELHPELSGRDRSHAAEALLAFALKERSALGGRSPAAEVLERILTLPLVEVLGGRQVSVAALLAEDQSRGALVFLGSRPLLSWRASEELLPILPAGSPPRELLARLVGEGHLREIPSPGLGRLLAGALQAANRSRATASAWLGSTLERLGERLTPPAPRESGTRVLERAPEAEDPEAGLLKALRREFALVARGRIRKRCARAFEGLDWATRPLGQPAWVSRGRLFLNRSHGTVCWIRDHFSEDPAALSLLLAHLVGLLNHADDAVEDPDEREFLQELVRDLQASFPD